MAVNVPLVTISGLTEQTTAADTDCMVIGGTDAKKIKWSTIISLIRTKLGIGSTSLNGIGDGTVTGAISALNTRTAWTKIFTGSRVINTAGAWNDSLSFSDFKVIIMDLVVSGWHHTVWFMTEGNGTNHCVSFGYYYTDGHHRVVTVRFQIAGRYLTDIAARIQYDTGAWTDVVTSVYVGAIYGWNPI